MTPSESDRTVTAEGNAAYPYGRRGLESHPLGHWYRVDRLKRCIWGSSRYFLDICEPQRPKAPPPGLSGEPNRRRSGTLVDVRID